MAIAHSWFDHITHKFFWRRHLEDVGAPVPRELGRWKELPSGEWGVEWYHPLVDEDIVIKLKDESNGIGDAFLLHGTGTDELGQPKIKDQAAMERYFRTKKGEQVGVLRDPYGKTLSKLKAPATGMLIGKLQHPLVNRGDAILHVAALESS